jgi:hypothetical protein
VGEESVEINDRRSTIADYCREIEAHLCKKNDGHLIRVVGPSFDLVSGWAARGVPLKVACAGVDRYFERYYSKGPRRRPVKVDFCEADVLDMFDEWRRATGITTQRLAEPRITDPESRERSHQLHESRIPNPESRHVSLPDHLTRVVTRLSQARALASASLGSGLDAVIDRVALELDAARAKPGGVRGEARASLIARLALLDAEMLAVARTSLDIGARAAIDQEADEELAPFRQQMAADAYLRSREAAAARLVRERCKLPTISFE